MASEAVKKILEAESESNRKISEARQKSEEIIRDAQGGASLLIQKRISEANTAALKSRSEYADKLGEYTRNAQAECDKQIAAIQQQAQQNMSGAVDEIIANVSTILSALSAELPRPRVLKRSQ